MRITHISPEYTYNKVNGTLSMKEKKSFFASKLVKFDDIISIESQNIVYYQDSQNQQINIASEQLLGAIVYNTDTDKLNNSSLIIDKGQSIDSLNNNTSWKFTINYGKILENYLFAIMKKYRTFEGVTNNITLNSDVNEAMRNYIKSNLLSIYGLSRVDLYLSYNDLQSPIRNNPVDNTVPLLKYNNLFTEKAYSTTNLLSKFTSKTDIINMVDVITFNQEKPSSNFSFNYYFNLYFTKI
jgi:hypothetical protein